MASIRARVGATNAVKVIASNSLSGSGSKLSDISDSLLPEPDNEFDAITFTALVAPTLALILAI
mgnify:CR=1